jgi:ribosomal protein L40E
VRLVSDPSEPESTLTFTMPDSGKYCRRCGAALSTESTFCDSCGLKIERPPYPKKAFLELGDITPRIRLLRSMTDLPDYRTAPNVARALVVAWEIMMQDIVGSLLVGLGYVAVVSLLPFIGVLLAGPLLLGVIGWGELKRQGEPQGCGAVTTITQDTFWRSILWSLAWVLILVGLSTLLAFPSMLFAPPVPPVTGIPPTGLISATVRLAVTIALSILFPLVLALLFTSGWALTQGFGFGVSLRWAFLRIWKHILRWWVAGLIFAFLWIAGAILLMLGLIFTVPFSAIFWAVLTGSTGEESSLSD